MSPSHTAPPLFVSFLVMGPVLSFVNSTHLLQAALPGIEAGEGSKEGGLCHRNYALTYQYLSLSKCGNV